MNSSRDLLASASLRAESFLVRYLLPIGYLVLLTGLLWLDDGGTYKRLYYWLFAGPTVIVLCLAPSSLRTIAREPIILAYMAFAAWVALSLLWTPADDAESYFKRPLYVLVLFLGCALIAANSQQRLLQVLKVAAVIAAFIAAVTVAHHLWTAVPGQRLVGFGALRNPLLSSHVFGFFAAYWIAALVTERHGFNWKAVLPCAALLAALVATGSRTPLAAVLACSLWLAIFAGRRAVVMVVGLLVLGAVVFAFSPDLLLERGLSYRPQIWGDAFSTALQRPLLGHGFHADFQFKIDLGLLSDPHNVELAVFLELGAIGLALWALMYGMAFWKVWQQRQDARFIAASALVVYGIVAGMSEGSSFLSRPNENWFLIWLPLSLMAALSIGERQARGITRRAAQSAEGSPTMGHYHGTPEG